MVSRHHARRTAGTTIAAIAATALALGAAPGAAADSASHGSLMPGLSPPAASFGQHWPGLPPIITGQYPTTTLLDGLNSPKGLTLDRTRTPIVGQGAFGPPAPVLEYLTRGRDRGQARPITAPLNTMAVASAWDGSLWRIGGDLTLYRTPRGGTEAAVLDFGAFDAANPDPYDTEGEPADSNPFDVITAANGDAIVADAAANSVVRVTPTGQATILARLATEWVGTDLVPAEQQPPGGLPPMIPAESVPTTVRFGPDGALYVGELKGFPFRPGSSRIWRIPAGVTGAVCSVNPGIPGQDCRTAFSGLTSIASMAFDRLGALFVFEYAAEGVGVFEEGLNTGNPPSAVLLRLWFGTRTEVDPGSFRAPGTIQAGSFGQLFLTDEVFGAGRLVRLGR